MRRVHALLLLACCLVAELHSGQALGQNVVDARTARVIAYWLPGDVQVYDVHRVKEGRKPGTSDYRITLKVLDATDSTYLVECQYSDLRVSADLPDDPRAAELIQRLMKATDGMRVLCATDETGIPIALVNEAEVSEHARTIMEQVLNMASNAEERRQMESAFAGVLSTQALAQSALEDIGNLLFAFGVEYVLNKTEKVRAEVPSPFGGTALRAQQEFTMTKLDTTKALATMHMEQMLDPKGLEEDLDMLAREVGGEGLSATQMAEMRSIIASTKINDRMDLVVDLNGAWTKHLHLVRSVEVKGVRETDTRTYSLR